MDDTFFAKNHQRNFFRAKQQMAQCNLHLEITALGTKMSMWDRQTMRTVKQRFYEVRCAHTHTRLHHIQQTPFYASFSIFKKKSTKLVIMPFEHLVADQAHHATIHFGEMINQRCDKKKRIQAEAGRFQFSYCPLEFKVWNAKGAKLTNKAKKNELSQN